MKKIFLILSILLFASPVMASQWCEWDGSQGTNCQSDSKGYIIINGFKVRTPSIANARGWYKLIVTQPTINEDTQIIVDKVWSKTDNLLGVTWTIRDLTADELNERAAGTMNKDVYEVWSALIAGGVFTQTQLANFLDAETVQAYLARKALEQ